MRGVNLVRPTATGRPSPGQRRAIAQAWIQLARSGSWDVPALARRWARATGLPQARLLGTAQQLIVAWPLFAAQDASADALVSWLWLQPSFKRLGRRAQALGARARPAVDALSPRAPPRLPGAPTLHNIDELGRLLGIDSGELLWLSDRCLHGAQGDRHYRVRLLPKRNGEPRLIEIPKARLKIVQQRILERLLDPTPVHPATHGFVCGRSALSHARLHVGASALLRLDLRDWFLRIGFARVRQVFLRMDLGADLATLLAQLCTVATPRVLARTLNTDQQEASSQRHLPQGAPSSPALANRVAARLDARLAGYAAQRRWCYSRYADDLVFSSREHAVAELRSALPALNQIIVDAGFQPHRRKCAVIAAQQQQRVTGIVVNERPNVARAVFDRLRAELHAWSCGRERLVAGESRETALQRLRGRLAWVAQVNPRRGSKLLEVLRRIESAPCAEVVAAVAGPA